jgi:hypothetical protein
MANPYKIHHLNDASHLSSWNKEEDENLLKALETARHYEMKLKKVFPFLCQVFNIHHSYSSSLKRWRFLQSITNQPSAIPNANQNESEEKHQSCGSPFFSFQFSPSIPSLPLPSSDSSCEKAIRDDNSIADDHFDLSAESNKFFPAQSTLILSTRSPPISRSNSPTFYQISSNSSLNINRYVNESHDNHLAAESSSPQTIYRSTRASQLKRSFSDSHYQDSRRYERWAKEEDKEVQYLKEYFEIPANSSKNISLFLKERPLLRSRAYSNIYQRSRNLGIYIHRGRMTSNHDHWDSDSENENEATTSEESE